MHPVAARKLHGRLVVTQSGTKLGHLKDVVLDADSTRVMQFIVNAGLMSGPDLLISSEEVIEIREDAIVVKDTLMSLAAPAVA